MELVLNSSKAHIYGADTYSFKNPILSENRPSQEDLMAIQGDFLVSGKIDVGYILHLDNNFNIVGRYKLKDVTCVSGIYAISNNNLFSFNYDRYDFLLADIIYVTYGFQRTYVINKLGSIIGWGDIVYGNILPSIAIVEPIQIAISSANTFVLQKNGDVIAWGRDYGDGKIIGTNIKKISANIASCFMLKNDGSVRFKSKNEDRIIKNNITNIATSTSNVMMISSNNEIFDFSSKIGEFDASNIKSIHLGTAGRSILTKDNKLFLNEIEKFNNIEVISTDSFVSGLIAYERIN